MHLCVCAFVRCVLPLYHALHHAWCVVHGIGMHVMHHIIVVVIIIMFIMFIIDHHHVRCSLFIDQSLNIDCCSLINVDHLLCERE